MTFDFISILESKRDNRRALAATVQQAGARAQGHDSWRSINTLDRAQ